MRVAVLVPCYRRPEYTEKCIRALEEAQEYRDTDFYLIDDGSNDGTDEILKGARLPKIVEIRQDNIGLRNTIIKFFREVEGRGYDYLVKMDSDCTVPKNWLRDILEVFQSSDAEILSPNVFPSNAAFKYGENVEGVPYRPSSHVGGLWAMRSSLPSGIFFDEFDVFGIKGAFHLLNQIIVEKEPRVGWLGQVTVQDIGHWSGLHPEHIKSEDHAEYSAHVGRSISWNA